jgi:hypothetical protein
MGQISMETMRLPGSALSGNQQYRPLACRRSRSVEPSRRSLQPTGPQNPTDPACPELPTAVPRDSRESGSARVFWRPLATDGPPRGQDVLDLASARKHNREAGK